MNLNNVNLALTAGLPSQLNSSVFSANIPNVALCGRSNVGKSSLINKLLLRKKLARVSGEPGKTITVNVYDIDRKIYLVDLPGYGYAKRSFDEREKWKRLIGEYFSLELPILFLLLVDLKVGLTRDDATMLEYLKESSLPFAVVATKADKLNKTDKAKCLSLLENDERIPDDADVIAFSSETGEGRDRVWELISEFCESLKDEA